MIRLYETNGCWGLWVYRLMASEKLVQHPASEVVGKTPERACCCRVVEGVMQAVRPALAASLPVELQARLAGTPHPTPGQARCLPADRLAQVTNRKHGTVVQLPLPAACAAQVMMTWVLVSC